MSTIKDRNDKDLTETEEIKWQEYTELYKKVLMTQTITIVLSTHLDLGTLECEVKWAFGSITRYKPNGGDGIPAELFKFLKDDTALSKSGNLENSIVVTELEKVSFHSNSEERQCQGIVKLQYNCTHDSKVMLKKDQSCPRS